MTAAQELKTRLPYMFEGKNLGIDIPRGWTSIIAKLCEDIDAVLGDDKRGFHIRQLKEKFGTMRFYWTMNRYSSPLRIDLISEVGAVGLTAKGGRPEDQVGNRIGELVCAAEAATEHTCIACGASPAELTEKKGYFLTLCDTHTKAWAQGQQLKIYGDEDAS